MVSLSFKLSLITSKYPETYQIHCHLQGCWRRHSHCSTQRLVCSPCCSRGSSQSEGGELWWGGASSWSLRLTLLTQFPLWVWSSLLLITVISPHSVAASLCSASSDINGVFISIHPNVESVDSAWLIHFLKIHNHFFGVNEKHYSLIHVLSKLISWLILSESRLQFFIVTSISVRQCNFFFSLPQSSSSQCI